MIENKASKTAIVISSSSSIEYTKFKLPGNIFILRQLVYVDDRVYRDVLEYEHEKFVQWMYDNPSKIANTSGSDANDIAELTMEIEKKGFTDVLFITPSAKLSATHETVKEMTDIMSKRMNIESFDTGSISAGEILFIVLAVKLINEGHTMQSVLNTLHTVKQNSNLYVMLNDVKYYAKHGRMSAAGGMLASLLDIKPIVEIHDGDVKVLHKIRKTDNTLKFFADFINKKFENKNSIGIGVYVGNMDLRDYLLKTVDNTRLAGEVPATPGFAAHLGPDAVAIAIHENKDDYIPSDLELKI